MRHLRPFAALLGIAALSVACSSPGASSGGDSSQPAEASQGGGASQPAASTGGGGGGGANGSITYQITGDYEASGELPFLPAPVSTWYESEGGWIANFANQSGEGAVIMLNTGVSGDFVLFSYGDGTAIIAASNDPGTGYDCTFTSDQNDANGLKGSLDCSNTSASNVTTGAILNVHVTAQWDAHP